MLLNTTARGCGIDKRIGLANSLCALLPVTADVPEHGEPQFNGVFRPLMCKKGATMKFQVDVSWVVLGGTIVEADTEEEARSIANNLPLSVFNGESLNDSFVVDCVEETTVE